MKRFVYVCGDPGVPVPGMKGASQHVAAVCRALAAAGLDGEVFAARANASELAGLPLRGLGLEVAASPPRVAQGRAGAGSRDVSDALAGMAARPRPSAPADFVYERYSLWHAGGLALARELGVPFVLEVNSPLPDEARHWRHLEHHALADALARLLIGEAAIVVCVSDEVAQWARERRSRSEGVCVVPNGVDASLFRPAPGFRPPPLPAGVPLVAFCGSFRPWHGTEDLIEAFRLLVDEWVPDAHLLCVGDGPERIPLVKRAAMLGLADRVHWTGAIPHDEVPHWLAGADVAVAPYPVLEHFYFSPLKIFEFMALGLPVVAAAAGQIPSIVGNCERGLLYAPGEPRGLADALARLLGDRALAQRMGGAGRRWVLEHATWERRVETIMSHVAQA